MGVGDLNSQRLKASNARHSKASRGMKASDLQSAVQSEPEEIFRRASRFACASLFCRNFFTQIGVRTATTAVLTCSAASLLAVAPVTHPSQEIESVQAASDLYSPVSGEILSVNEALTGKPELVNEDAEGAGWIYKIKPSLPNSTHYWIRKLISLTYGSKVDAPRIKLRRSNAI